MCLVDCGDFRGYGSMNALPLARVVLAFCLVFVMSAYSINGENTHEAAVEKVPEPPILEFPDDPLDAPQHTVSVEAVVVNPFRSAHVGSQVGGIIDQFYFDEGDLVREGQVVLEINPARYRLNAQRADDKLKGLEVALSRLKEEAALKSELFDLDALARQDIIKAKSEVEMMQYRVGEARKELDLARLDLESCQVKAPFTGYLAIRSKQPGEPAERLEKLFFLVDSSKVYAVANVPESLLSQFPKGTDAVYISSSKQAYKGTVHRIGKLIDPKSRTKRVYLLIDNAGAGLEVGTTGSLQLLK
jgi:RND family efflux transporter MFP subunit